MLQNIYMMAWVQGIPRKIWLDVNAPTDLLQWPVEEVEKLRISNVSRENFTLGAGSVVPLEGVIGVQVRERPVLDSKNPVSSL
jgi:beta-fructofuranosidase